MERKGKRLVKSCAIAFRRWLYAAPCLLCGAGTGRGAGGLCRGCRADLPWRGPACRRCGKELAVAGVCGACLHDPPAQEELVCPFDYAAPLDHLVRRLKFGGDLACARLLGQLMAAHVARSAACRPELIIPMPLHRRRLAGRGFNQALELARPLARRLGVPIEASACIRHRATAEQSTLAAAARRVNVNGAFAVRLPLPASVAIVDDVLTTGSTAAALMAELKRAGVSRIALWICARAPLSHG
jgi:ComF family protein